MWQTEPMKQPPPNEPTKTRLTFWKPHFVSWRSGGILHVLALVDMGAEVTVLHSNINNKEATSDLWIRGKFNPWPLS